MKRTPIKQISDKQQLEIENRQELKTELIAEFGNHCMTCGHLPDWRGLSLSHIIPLSRLGKTTKANCVTECGICHDKYEKKPENRPLWQQIQAGVMSNE